MADAFLKCVNPSEVGFVSIFLRTAVVINVFVGLLWGQSPAVPERVKSMTLTGIARPNGNGFRTVDHGYLVSVQRTIVNDHDANIFVTSLTTMDQRKLTFWLPGAVQIQAEDAAVGLNGHLVVVGTVVKSDFKKASIMAELDSTGSLLATHDLGEYTAVRVCAAADGNYWTLGQVWAAELNRKWSYAMLREYLPNGSLARSYFPRRNVRSSAILNLHRSVTGGARAFLTCGDQSVGVFLAHSWTEVQLSDGLVERWHIAARPGRITGITLVAKNDVYASFRNETNAPYFRGIFALAPDTAFMATWAPISTLSSTDSSDHRTFNVVGRDGHNIIYDDRGSDGKPALEWAGPHR